MDNSKHMSILLETTNDLMTKIDQLPCHPKYKLSLYHRFILSKIAWHLTIADLSKTWVVQTLDTVVAKFVRHWLELPITATLSQLIISKSNYGLSLILPSTKFIQCQTNNYTKCSKILSQPRYQTSMARFQSVYKCTV